MDIEDSSRGAKESTIMLGSGLSGMVAAYISARALEENASRDENWSAERVFRPKSPRWRPRKNRPSGPGPALAS